MDAIESACSMHARCIIQRDEVRERMDHARGCMHPIRRMPEELLESIMLIAIAEASKDAMDLEDDDSTSHLPSRRRLRRLPCRLAGVFRAWRRTALHSPALWVHVVLKFDDICASRQWAVKNASEGLDVQLARAGRRDLILFIDGDPSRSHAVDYWVSDAIWVSSLLCRVIHLQMGNLSDSSFYGVDVSEIDHSRILTAEFYSISSGNLRPSSATSALFDWMASGIRNLRCAGCSISWDRLCPLPAQLFFELDGYQEYLTSLDLIKIAEDAPNITQLNINNGDLGEQDPPSGTIDFHHVQHLRLLGRSSRAVCTALRFPDLRTAELGLQDYEYEPCTLLLQNGVASFDTNRLRSLCLYSTDATQALAHIFYDLQLVENLEISSCRHTEGFCSHMWKKDARGRWALPRLLKLDILEHCPNETRSYKLFEEPLLQMIRQRQEISRVSASGLATLVHCVVQYACDDYLLSEDFDDQLQKVISAGL